MTYDAIESSRDKGSPVELYYFRHGSDPGAFYAYSDVESDVVYFGDTYRKLRIKRGSVVASGSLDKSRLTVSVPPDSEIAELFRVYPPGRVVTLTIRAGHLTDPDGEFPVVWVGRVLQCSRGNSPGPDAELTCEPANTSMRRSGLRRNYQLSCPHVLYASGPGLCNADKAVATYATTVVLKGQATLTLPPGWHGPRDPEKFIGGLASWVTASLTEQRTILRVTGDTVHLTGPTPGLSVGDPVSVTLGCNHQTSDCQFLHVTEGSPNPGGGNILNYGGQPFIPLKSPIATANFTGG